MNQLEQDREDTWRKLLDALVEAHYYAYQLQMSPEYQEMAKLTQHFINSAKWHKRQYE